MTTKEDYNKEWIELSQQMQSLEIKRRELYNKHKKEFGSIDLKTENNPSMFYDLNRNNINISKLN
jgi:hypothetical protein|tara:strand:+ start:1168 stop:1362 length:195 start_codon:yes stop_codon:yes gene_type:complete